MNRKPLWTLATGIAMIAVLALVSGVFGTADSVHAEGGDPGGVIGIDPPDTIPDDSTGGGGTSMAVQEPSASTPTALEPATVLGTLSLILMMM